MFPTYQLSTAIGQLLDIAGVIILFYTGLPFKLPERNLYIEEEITPEQIIKDKKQKGFAYLGLALLLIGFVLQFIGTILSIKK